MSSVQLETLIERMSILTEDLNQELGNISDKDFQGMSKSDRADMLKSMEHFEVLLGKMEAISKKTERDAIPEIMANENKSENKLENKQTPKKRISNLMKPTLNNNFQNNQDDKKKKD